MIRRQARLAASIGVAAILAVRGAAAAPNDKEVESLVESVMTTDYAAGKFDDAIAQLELGKQACAARASCSPKVRAKLQIAVGTVLAGGLKKTDEAKKAFAAALADDPTANLIADLVTPEVQKAFDEVRSGSSASGGTPETIAKSPTERKPKKTYAGGGRPVRGWRNPEAFFYWDEARKAEASRDWLDCVDYAQASIAAENRQTTRYLAATCEERAGLWVEAVADYQTVINAAGKLGMRDVERQARGKLTALRDRIPRVVIEKPAKGEGLVVKLNDAEVPADKLGGEIWVNPGQRTVTARGTVDGVPMEFEEVIDVAEGKTLTVDVKLQPKGARKDQTMMRCMLAAQTRDDFAKCLSPGGPSLDVHMGLELSGYHDTDHVDVVTPALVVTLESPTAGWGVNASMLVDVVTAASADILATASPRWREERYVPTIGAHKKFGDADVRVKGVLSREPDYLATSVGAGASLDLRQKTITPSLDYEFSYDISGRAGTPFSVFSHVITRHALDLATTFVLDKGTLFAATFTAIFENGDTSKPYRHVPMFLPGIAPRVPAGLAIDAVNMVREPISPFEQLPLNRQRWALAGLLAHRFSSSTIRAEERLYVDSWGLKATTTDLQYLIDIGERVRIWPQVRGHAQTGTSFWQLAYVGTPDATGPGFSIPALRAGDRELGPLVGVTGGGGVRVALGEKKAWALSVVGNVNYTRFLDTLYLVDRIGYFGATTLEVDFQ